GDAVDMDSEKFSDKVNHSKLVEVLSHTVKDGWLVSPTHKYLNARGAGLMQDRGRPKAGYKFIPRAVASETKKKRMSQRTSSLCVVQCNVRSSQNYSATTSKGTCTFTSLCRLRLATYSPNTLGSSSKVIRRRSTSKPCFLRASATWMLFTDPKILPVSPALAPMVSFKPSSLAANSLASFLIFSCLNCAWRMFSANTFFAEGVASSANPCGMR